MNVSTFCLSKGAESHTPEVEMKSEKETSMETMETMKTELASEHFVALSIFTHIEKSIFDLQSGSHAGLIGLCVSFPTTPDLFYPLPKTGEEQYAFTKQNHNRKKNCYHE